MNDEIKAFLVNIKNNEEWKQIYDYITNLQEENEELKKNQRYYKNGVFSLEYDKETMSDMIDDLKQENERLKEIWEDTRTFIKDNKRLVMNKNGYDVYEDCKSRIEKAVEYINKHKEPLHHSFDEPDCDYWIATNPQDIIDILNGKE